MSDHHNIRSVFQYLVDRQRIHEEVQRQSSAAGRLVSDAKAKLLEQLKTQENLQRLSLEALEAPVLVDGYHIHIDESLKTIDIEKAPRVLSVEEAFSRGEPTDG